MSQGEKNVQLDPDSNPEPSEYRSVDLPTELPGRIHTISSNHEQYYTVTYSPAILKFVLEFLMGTENNSH